MKNLIKYLLFFSFTLSLSGAFAQNRMTLKECLDVAIKNNLTYRESQIQAEVANAELVRVKSLQYPRIGFGVGQDLRIGRSIDRFTNSYIEELYSTNGFGIDASVTLFNGFQIKNQIQQNILLKEAGAKGIEASRNLITINLLQAYLQVLASQELVEVALQQVETSKAQLDRINKMVSAGIVGQAEYFLVRSQLANDEFSFVTTKNSLKTNRLLLFQLMNLTPSNNIVFEPLADEVNIYKVDDNFVNQLYDQSLANFPSVKRAELQLRSFENLLRATRANVMPNISLSASYGAFYSTSNKNENYVQQINGTRNGSLSLNFNIPILGGLQNRPRIAAVKVQRQLTENNLNLAKLQLRQAIEQSFQSFDAASERYKVATDQVNINQDNIKAVESKISAGTVNSVEYVLAKTNFDRARSNLVQAKYEVLLQQKILDFYKDGEWKIN
ncbi:TolC family protein [Emticicia sp. BO119]|uniref:TolC family protein n=1 Tax=Emticicia sp. BO119 TaxID=2757768 RepID=UPI0015EFF083|nr:TolC family protein [Emticicia sp. BO119]MBA4850240.1 TolC family protein [Emticicia sp. BO119]